MTNWRYSYSHENKWPSEAVDTHHVFVLRSNKCRKGFLVGLFAAIALVNAFYLFLIKEKSAMAGFWTFLLDAFLVKLFVWKPLQKESVVVMPSFGVQLETHYVSGKVIRRFIPVDRIMKPVLLECVTPVTCYWSLSLIVRDEDELMSVFKELRPPLKILIPIWKALRAATGGDDSRDA